MNFMPNRPSKGNTTLDLLLDLVDEDINQQWHGLGWLTFAFYSIIVSLSLLAFLLLWAAFQVVTLIGTTLFVGSIATIGTVVTLHFNSSQLLESSIRRERFSRISKQPRFRSISTPRNKLILCSLIEIGSTLPISLREAKLVMPDLFKEERLLPYLLEAR